MAHIKPTSVVGRNRRAGVRWGICLFGAQSRTCASQRRDWALQGRRGFGPSVKTEMCSSGA